MNDDRANRGNPDRQRIDPNDPDEVRDWSRSLAVTADQLRDPVQAVGPEASRVRDYLGK